jgi:hypothetical protein
VLIHYLWLQEKATAWAAEVLSLEQSPPINVDGDAEDGAGGGFDAAVHEDIGEV